MSLSVNFPLHLNLLEAWDFLPGHCIAAPYMRKQSLCFWAKIYARDGKTYQGLKIKPLLLVGSRNPRWAGVPRLGHLGIMIFLGRPWPCVHSSPVLHTGTIARAKRAGRLLTHPWCDPLRAAEKGQDCAGFTVIFSVSISTTNNSYDGCFLWAFCA